MKQYIFGVDIGGTSIKFGLFEESRALLKKWEIPTDCRDSGRNILPDVCAAIHGAMQEQRLRPEMIVGVGVGVPCIVDRKGVVLGAANIGWGVCHPAKVLEERLKLPVIVKKDSAMASLGEMVYGAGKGSSDLVMITLGTGVGCGIIAEGNVLTGIFGGAGEIGHICVNEAETEKCGCGKKGCLEQYTSARGIVRLAKVYLEKHSEESVLRNQMITAKTVFDAVKRKDEAAIEIAKQFGNYLGKGLATIAEIVNPEMFIIGGGVSNAGEILLKYVKPVFEQSVIPFCRGTRLVLAELGNDAGIYGAAETVRIEKHHSRKIF